MARMVSKTTPGWARRNSGYGTAPCPPQPVPSGTIKAADYWRPAASVMMGVTCSVTVCEGSVGRMTGCILQEAKAKTVDPGLGVSGPQVGKLKMENSTKASAEALAAVGMQD